MRVLHVAESTAGGLGTYLSAIAGAGVDRAFEVHVAAPLLPRLHPQLQSSGAEIHEWRATARPGPEVRHEIQSLARIVAAADPDVVHLHSSKAGLAGRLLLRGRKPTMLQPHSWSFIAVTGFWSHAARRWERGAARWTDVVLCVSEAERQIGMGAGIRARFVVVPNGVDLSRFAHAERAARAEARKRLNVGQEPLAICVGRLHRQKNQTALLDAWPAVRARLPMARLALVGGGPDAEALASRHVTGVDLVGEVADPRDWYAAADVVVQPSRWEGMSLAVLEAFATGRSVVATRVVGMTEIVEESALVPPGDVRALVDAVTQRLADADVAAAEGARGRARVESAHDLQAHLRSVCDLTAEVATRSGPP